MFRRSRIILGAALTAALALTTPAAVASAAPPPDGAFPSPIVLPDGFQPEGIAIGSAPVAYFGSLVDGDLYRVDLVSGEGEVFSQGPGTNSVGMKVDSRGRLWVAGGGGGDGRVVDTRSGDVLANYSFASAPTFVNDVVVTKDAAWFTDSFNPVLYKVPIGANGALADQNAVETIPLTGDYVQEQGFNANGIAQTPDRAALLIVQTATGSVFRVDPATGATTTVDLGGYSLTGGDGLLVVGHTFYAVENGLNQVAVFDLDRDGTAGTLVKTITNGAFDVPTTIAAFGNRLYLTNARFTTPPTPDTEYTAVGVRR
ncbi:SMP-30/gluconolactonase/LRE family protein [Microbacterium sp. B2969]|uniref:SMP-30/gluconolactonase/LRE family protein n=1 Tax=Microbacterium alkaliflavum TaxID=3248839 RepID=A0ABW7Q9T8_9MICO